MNALRATLLSLGQAMAPDGKLMRGRMRDRLDLLLTLLFVMVALGLTVGYQVLRHLPASWRTSLLGDDQPPA